MTELTGRAPMRSPGKPSLRRDVERLFWQEITTGLSSEEAALAVGASQAAGSRWFRERGGMATFMIKPLSGRYLCFEEREEIALLRAKGAGVREIARRLGRSACDPVRSRRNALPPTKDHDCSRYYERWEPAAQEAPSVQPLLNSALIPEAQRSRRR
jgi:hypothetical protein